MIDNERNEMREWMGNKRGVERNNMYSIVGEKKGNLFLGRENGVCLYNVKEESFRKWRGEEGLEGGKFNGSGGIDRGKGEVIFGRKEGVIMLGERVEVG